MASLNNRALYVGVTNDLQRRVDEHKQHRLPGFTEKYNCVKLVYFEETDEVDVAIWREKQIKAWRREKKNRLVNMNNPYWQDLYPDLFG